MPVVIPDYAEGTFPAPGTKRHKGPPEFLHLSIEGFDRERPHGKHTGFIIHWGAKDMGWGNLFFVQNKDGTIECETECMGDDFVKAALEEVFKKLIIK